MLRSVEEHKDQFRTDELQQLHAMHNLAEMLDRKPAGVSPTLRDSSLREQVRISEVGSLPQIFLCQFHVGQRQWLALCGCLVSVHVSRFFFFLMSRSFVRRWHISENFDKIIINFDSISETVKSEDTKVLQSSKIVQQGC